MTINPFEVIKNAQKLQEQMGSFQERLKFVSVTGSAGGGMVEIDLNGLIEVLAVRISPELVTGGDIEMLQDLVAAAFTSAYEKIRKLIGEEMNAITGNMGMGMTNLPGTL